MAQKYKGVKDLEEGFVKISFEDEPGAKGEPDFHQVFARQATGKHIGFEVYGADALRKLYPKHSLVMTQDYRLNVLAFPGAYALPLDTSNLTTNLIYIPLARRLGSVPGVLVDSIEFGSFKVAWDKYEFIVYQAKWLAGFSLLNQTFILHEGAEAPVRNFLLAAGTWQNELHEEIWVFDQGYWRKDHGLWIEVQKASWSDVVLKDEFKKSLQKDVYGFFDSEPIYKELSIPWKRGIIMHGPPGNGKTISLKIIMKTCDAKGFKPLYVKSFQSYRGEEAAMADVFNHARQLSPCVVVLEDLDSLINDRNRSFFLNQLDGLEGNDGLLVIGTTNHFDRLDPGLSTRPSRFDRKYLFDDPDRTERALYASYWQAKLETNEAISFPDSLVDEVADATDQFSFAYLKEAFVSTLVLLAGNKDSNKPDFATTLMQTISTLREQLDKAPKQNGTWWRRPPPAVPTPLPHYGLPVPQDRNYCGSNNLPADCATRADGGRQRVFITPTRGDVPTSFEESRLRRLLGGLSHRSNNEFTSDRIYSSYPAPNASVSPPMPGYLPFEGGRRPQQFD